MACTEVLERRLFLAVSNFFPDPATHYAAGDGPGFAAIADLDGDGDADLVVSNDATDDVSVFKNNGNGTFATQVRYPVGDYPHAVVTADIDGDGDNDIVTANFYASTVSVLKNNGNGTFAASVAYPGGYSTSDVAAADVDGDGDVDLVTVDYHVHLASVLKNNGNGTFAAPVSYSAGGYPDDITMADIDGDGDADVLTANEGGNDMAVLKNNGDGTFAAQVRYAAAVRPHSIVAADLDADGDLDAVTANDGSISVSVFKNNGNGTFAAAVAYSVGVAPLSVAATDIDQDGDIDLVTANRANNDVSVLLNNGNGTFAVQKRYAAGYSVRAVAAADLDGDTDVDLVTANYTTDDISVLRNVNADNQAPTGLSLSSASVPENSSISTAVGTLSTIDPDDTAGFTYSLVSGDGATDNGLFTIVGDQLRTAAVFDYETGSTRSIRVRTTDSEGASYEKAFSITVTDVDEVAPAVVSATIADSPQRSMVRKITVVFSEDVDAAGAFSLRRTSGALVPDVTILSQNPLPGRSTFELTFEGPAIVGGSLPDGLYRLVISAADAHDLAGNALAADYTLRFHRLFGDADGDRDVDTKDLTAFRSAFNKVSAYNAIFDFDGSTTINVLDYNQLKSRLVKTIVR